MAIIKQRVTINLSSYGKKQLDALVDKYQETKSQIMHRALDKFYENDFKNEDDKNESN